jgi:hypothetical protein
MRTLTTGGRSGPPVAQVERTTEVRPVAAFVDRGFKGAAHHPAGVAVYVSGRKRLGRTLKALLRRRAAIEPDIGHFKQEHKWSAIICSVKKATASTRY